jgi:hypothetical protein
MLPWPEKCNACACRMCAHVETCKLHPCDACGDATLMPGSCSLEAGKAGRLNPEDVVDAYNRLCPSLPKVRAITEQRRRKIRAQRASIAEFEEVFRLAEASEFLSGRSGDWTGCGFDWLLKPENFQKVIEGTYNKEAVKKSTNAALGYKQKRYSEADLAHIFVNLDGN